MRKITISKTLTVSALSLLIGINTFAQTAPAIDTAKAPSKIKLMALTEAKTLAAPQLAVLKQHAIGYLVSVLKDPAAFAQTKAVAATNILDLSQKDTTKEESELLKGLAKLVDAGQLTNLLNQIIEQIKKEDNGISKQLKALPPEQLAYAKATLQASIEGILRVRGLTADSKSNVYVEWSALSDSMVKKVEADATNANMLSFSKSSWVRTRRAEILVNGPASFAKRDLFMKNASQSINILTWSIYDDLTGTEAADLLIARKKENKDLKIRIIVDGQVAATPGHGDQVKRLEDAGIEVIRWISTSKPFAGQHRKMIIIDNDKMIAGGLNFGDVYSHKNPDLKIPRWRDTDILVEGSGAAEGNRLFAQIWNDQIASRKLSLKPLKVPAKIKSAVNEDLEISVINHDVIPEQQGSTVMMTILKAIRSASTQIDIENAYIILFPALKNELKDAIQKRHVKVRVFTNSSESVDEPIVTIPILRSVAEFADMGAEVYIKRGATLHSKLLVVDSLYTMIMSYNLHPRSERVEGEMAVIVRDKKFANNVHAVFTNDTTSDKAYRILSSADVKLPDSPVSVPTLRLFFDML